MTKGIQRYSKDVILSAIEKLKDGESLSAIAREMGLPKTTVKYWIDNATKFTGETGAPEGANAQVVRLQNQIVDYGWRLLFKLYKRIQLKMKDAAFRDLVYGASELQARLTQLRTLSGGAAGGPAMMEVSEETKLTVRTFLEKKKQQQDTQEEANSGLTTPALERLPDAKEGAAGGGADELATGGNGANG